MGSSPVFSDTLTGSNNWLDTFMDFCKSNHCLPDFINMHFYPMNLPGHDVTTISRKTHREMRRYLGRGGGFNASPLKRGFMNLKST